MLGFSQVKESEISASRLIQPRLSRSLFLRWFGKSPGNFNLVNLDKKDLKLTGSNDSEVTLHCLIGTTNQKRRIQPSAVL